MDIADQYTIYEIFFLDYDRLLCFLVNNDNDLSLSVSSYIYFDLFSQRKEIR